MEYSHPDGCAQALNLPRVSSANLEISIEAMLAEKQPRKRRNLAPLELPRSVSDPLRLRAFVLFYALQMGQLERLGLVGRSGDTITFISTELLAAVAGMRISRRTVKPGNVLAELRVRGAL